MTETHNTHNWSNPATVLENTHEFGTLVSKALQDLDSSKSELFAYMTVMETILTTKFIEELKSKVQEFYPTATGITWDAYTTDKYGNLAVTFESIQLSDGTSIAEDSVWDDEEESVKFSKVEDICTQLIYNFDLYTLRNEHVDF